MEIAPGSFSDVLRKPFERAPRNLETFLNHLLGSLRQNVELLTCVEAPLGTEKYGGSNSKSEPMLCKFRYLSFSLFGMPASAYGNCQNIKLNYYRVIHTFYNA